MMLFAIPATFGEFLDQAYPIIGGLVVLLIPIVIGIIQSAITTKLAKIGESIANKTEEKQGEIKEGLSGVMASQLAFEQRTEINAFKAEITSIKMKLDLLSEEGKTVANARLAELEAKVINNA